MRSDSTPLNVGTALSTLIQHGFEFAGSPFMYRGKCIQIMRRERDRLTTSIINAKGTNRATAKIFLPGVITWGIVATSQEKLVDLIDFMTLDNPISNDGLHERCKGEQERSPAHHSRKDISMSDKVRASGPQVFVIYNTNESDVSKTVVEGIGLEYLSRHTKGDYGSAAAFAGDVSAQLFPANGHFLVAEPTENGVEFTLKRRSHGTSATVKSYNGGLNSHLRHIAADVNALLSGRGFSQSHEGSDN